MNHFNSYELGVNQALGNGIIKLLLVGGCYTTDLNWTQKTLPTTEPVA